MAWVFKTKEEAEEMAGTFIGWSRIDIEKHYDFYNEVDGYLIVCDKTRVLQTDGTIPVILSRLPKTC